MLAIWFDKYLYVNEDIFNKIKNNWCSRTPSRVDFYRFYIQLDQNHYKFGINKVT